MTMIIAILVFVSFYGVIRISRQIMGNASHLTEDDILEYKYRRRSLSESFQRRITNHIGTCDDCRKKFTEIMNG